MDRGSWNIQVNQIFPSYDNKICVIRYIISTEKVGSFDVMALLKSDNGQTIDAIDEIFYQITKN